jgi:Immunity protein 52
MTTGIDYEYSVRGSWLGPASEKPAITGAKFLKTLDALSGIDPIFSGWMFTGAWQLSEGHRDRYVPLAVGRERVAEIVEQGVYIDDSKEPCPELGHSVFAIAGPRGPRRISLTASTKRQSLHLQFGEWNIASDLSIVTYPLFKAALLAISAAWDVQWACAQAFRLGAVRVPIDFASGVPAFRIDSVVQVPLDPTFPKSIFHVPWIAYLSEALAPGLTPAGEILTERTLDGGLLMSAATERLDPTNPKHVRRARILAETMIAQVGVAAHER